MKKNSNNKTIFVGGDVGVYQYIWLIHLLDGYSQKNKISTIIFEYKKDFEKIKKYKNLIKFNNKYKILYLDELLPSWFSNKYLKLFVFSIKTMILFLNIKFFEESFFKNFTSKGVYYGIMDFAFRNSNNLISPGIGDLLFSSYHFVQKKYKANFLSNYNLNAVFLAHSVYHSRAFLNKFREENIKIFNISWSLYQQDKLNDSMWDFPSVEFFNLSKQMYNKDVIDDYWKKRQQGSGNYTDSNFASISHKKSDYQNIDNVLFLHVFKDSPNAYIDETKIFRDYISWFIETLKIISVSKEKWLIKMHPSYKKWGEDQPSIVQAIIKSVSKRHKLTNIIIDNLERSNVFVLQNAKKIVTYSGTCAIESICNGKKPIIISSTMLDQYNSDLVHKPKNIKEYSELILNKYAEQDFKLSDSDIQFAKFLLYIRENVLNLIPELDYKYLYSPTFEDYTIKNYFKIIEEKENYLNRLGKLLGNKITHSVSEKFLNKIYE